MLEQPARERDALPFDMRTITVSLWRRRFSLLAAVVVSVALGLLVGRLFSRPSYQSQASLLYTPRNNDSASVYTLQNAIPVQSNLEKLQAQLRLPVPIDELRRAITVDVQKNTTLLDVAVLWSDPQTAADVANRLCQIFLDDQAALRKDRQAARVHLLQERLAAAHADVDKAQAAVSAFIRAHQGDGFVPDPMAADQEMQQLDQEIAQARIGLQSIDMQMGTANQQVQRMAGVVSQERARLEAAAQVQRAQQLKAAIQESHQNRAALHDLQAAQAELIRTRQWAAEGLVSEVELQKVKDAFEHQQLMTQDDAPAAGLRSELEKIDSGPVDTPTVAMAPSESALDQAQAHVQALGVERMAAAETLKELQTRREQLDASRHLRPQLQSHYQDLTQAVAARQADLKNLEDLMTQAVLSSSDPPELKVLSAAVPPERPAADHARILGAVVTLVSMLAFGAFIGARELMSPLARSRAELSLRLGIPVLGALADAPDALAVDGWLARRLRKQVPGKGMRVLVTSAEPHEGKTVVSAMLGRALAEQGERVMLLEADRRGTPAQVDMRGVTVVTRDDVTPVSVTGRPDWPRVLASAATTHDVTVIDGPPADRSIDASLLADNCDAIVLVVNSQHTPWQSARKALNRLAEAGRPVVAILNQVIPEYLENA